MIRLEVLPELRMEDLRQLRSDLRSVWITLECLHKDRMGAGDLESGANMAAVCDAMECVVNELAYADTQWTLGRKECE